MVDIFKALGDESRLRILNILVNDTVCVCQLEGGLGLSQTNVSRHLLKLKSAGLVISSRKAQWIYYEVNVEVFNGYPGLMECLQIEFSNDDRYTEDKNKYFEIKNETCEKPGCC